MNRRLVLALLAFAALAPAVHAGGRPIPMQEIIDSPFTWPGGKEGTMDKAEKAVLAGLTAKGWTATQAGPGKTHAMLHRDDWRCEIDVVFDAKKYSILYSNSEKLDYNPDKKVIHRNFNRWLTLLQEQINLAAQNSG